VLIADKGYDSHWFREALSVLEITPCIPRQTNRKAPVPTTQSSTSSAIASSECSAGSRTGDASPPDTTAAPTPS
jgi:IS5 family transposase